MGKLVRNLSTEKTVAVLVFAFIFLWGIGQVINITAFNSDDEDVKILKDLSSDDFTKLAGQGFKWLIVALATILAFRFGAGTGRIDRKSMVNMVIIAVILFVLYNLVSNLLPGLVPNLDQAAVQLQAITTP